MDQNLSIVGLLFAGSSRITFHNHTTNVQADRAAVRLTLI